ncbi:pyridoxamine 5'-phosphate oxidase family protein [Mesobacterium pallidum]|uniref:pyridoxamine 5'-phosphate oxidase family protein n=1 Tax=Mesobacterium pallidum TaxID=2872037 RepID=UPI001EE285FA|nr:pyridoxamine 5'-phosphate oxidase family protein [Mesobacterium pallidum]
MAQDLKSEFWNRIDKAQAGMLEAGGAEMTPMSHFADKDEGVLYFITAEGTDVERACHGSAQATHVVADSKAHLYARVEGTLTQEKNESKLDELWSPVAGAWFDKGRDDPKVRLIKFTPKTAEIWATDGAAGFMYEIAKANLTDETPDVGDHGLIVF